MENVLNANFVSSLILPQVHLVPQSLARKRVWNKKYPICIELGKQDDFMSKAEGDRWEASESLNTRDRGEGTSGAQERGSSSSSRDLTLYLFGRTGREKEEWFQRFLSASKLKTDVKNTSGVAGSKSGEHKTFLSFLNCRRQCWGTFLLICHLFVFFKAKIIKVFLIRIYSYTIQLEKWQSEA